MENGKQGISEQLDKLIRLFYAVSANDSELLEQVKKMISSWLASWTARNVDTKIVKRIEDNEWSNAIAA